MEESEATLKKTSSKFLTSAPIRVTQLHHKHGGEVLRKGVKISQKALPISGGGGTPPKKIETLATAASGVGGIRDFRLSAARKVTIHHSKGEKGKNWRREWSGVD